MPLLDIKSMIKRAKEWLRSATIPQLLRYLTGREVEYQSLIAKLADLNTLVSTSASEDDDYKVDVSGGGPEFGTNESPKFKQHRDLISGKETIQTHHGRVVPLQDFKAPNRNSVAKYAQLIDEAEAAIVELDIAFARLKSSKEAYIKDRIKSLNEIRDKLQENKEQAIDTMTELFHKHAPAQVIELTDNLVMGINGALDSDTYSGVERGDFTITSHETFAGIKNAAIEFTAYIYLDGLDKDSFTTTEMVLALTFVVYETAQTKSVMKERVLTAPEKRKLNAVNKRLEALKGVKTKAAATERAELTDQLTALTSPEVKVSADRSLFTMAIFLTSLPKFAAPGHFNPGVQISGNSNSNISRNLFKEAMQLISVHSILPLIGRIKIDKTTQQLRHSPLTNVGGVDDAINDNGDIVLTLATDNPKVIQNNIWPDVLVALNSVIARTRRDAKFTYKLEQSGSKQVMRISYVKG